MRQFTHGSLFAGVEGLGLGFRRAGFRTVWAVEKEPFCQAVLKTQFPGTELHSDVHHVGKRNLAAVDVLTFGFPCQDLSVAGKRAGLGGTRSGLFWQAHRIVGELRPRWFLVENVPGLFSSAEGEDFAIVLRELGKLGYGLAWRVLDSQFFGVAQRRRRVFIVGCLGKPCPATVLFEPESGEGDFAEGCEEGSDIAVPLTSGTGVTGSSAGRRCEDDFNLAVCGSSGERERALTGSMHKRHDEDTDTLVATRELAATLGERMRGQDDSCADNLQLARSISASNGHHGHSSPRGDGSDNLIAHPITASYGKQVDSSDRNGGLVAYTLRSEHRGIGNGHNTKGGTIVGTINAGGNSGGFRTEPGEHLVCADGLSGSPDGMPGVRERGNTSEQRPGTRSGRNSDSARDERSAPDSHRMRDFTRLPQGLDSARYRALGNAVTTNVAEWIALRIKAQLEKEESSAPLSGPEDRGQEFEVVRSRSEK